MIFLIKLIGKILTLSLYVGASLLLYLFVANVILETNVIDLGKESLNRFGSSINFNERRQDE